MWFACNTAAGCSGLAKGDAVVVVYPAWERRWSRDLGVRITWWSAWKLGLLFQWQQTGWDRQREAGPQIIFPRCGCDDLMSLVHSFASICLGTICSSVPPLANRCLGGRLGHTNLHTWVNPYNPLWCLVRNDFKLPQVMATRLAPLWNALHQQGQWFDITHLSVARPNLEITFEWSWICMVQFSNLYSLCPITPCAFGLEQNLENLLQDFVCVQT